MTKLFHSKYFFASFSLEHSLQVIKLRNAHCPCITNTNNNNLYHYITLFSTGDTDALINALKDTFGDALDSSTLQAMEVGAAMEKAGSSKEEIEEMMAMIMNKDGGISQEFLDNVRKAMESGSK